jgi:hypothetical protein
MTGSLPLKRRHGTQLHVEIARPVSAFVSMLMAVVTLMLLIVCLYQRREPRARAGRIA